MKQKHFLLAIHGIDHQMRWKVVRKGWSAEEIPDEPETYATTTCTACGQLHLVNRISGRVLGDRED